jgi:hypothetical protein
MVYQYTMFRDTHHGKPCRYCRRPMDRNSARLQATRDHYNPRSRGGGEVMISCLTCNGIKGNMPPEAWEAFMEAHPRWWTLTKGDLRAIRRAAIGLPPVSARRTRRIQYSTAPKRLPVVVPPELIWP